MSYPRHCVWHIVGVRLRVPVTEPCCHLPRLCLCFSSFNPSISISVIIFIHVCDMYFFAPHFFSAYYKPIPVLSTGVIEVKRTWSLPLKNSQSRKEDGVFEVMITL